jgi:hypothetical protein
MADCIQAQITAHIKAALRTITKANNYNYDVGAVEEERKDLKINDRYEYILMIEDDPTFENPDEQDYIRFLDYRLWFFSSQNDDVTGDAATDNNSEIAHYNRNAIADMTVALHVDPTRGDLAQNTDVIPGSHAMHEDYGLFGTYCDVRVTTDIDATNPYEKR